MRHPKLPLRVVLIAHAALLGATAAFARPADGDRLRDTETRQQQIREQTQAAADRIAAIIAEFERNGLGDGEDVKVLRALHNSLGNLSADQMRKVVTLLQQARQAPDATAASGSVRDAYGQQQRIVDDMRRLLSEYQRQQSIYALSARLRQLSDRQQAALRSAVDLAKAKGIGGGGGGGGANLDDQTRASFAVQAAEQTAIASEVADALDAVTAMAAAPPTDEDPGAGDRLRGAARFADERTLRAQSAQAAGDLQGSSLFRAATAQRATRDSLRQLARLVASPRDLERQLHDAADDLQRLIELQQSVARQETLTKTTTDNAAVERRTGDLVDRSDMVRGDLDTIAPAAADLAREAIRRQQSARARLDANQRGAADEFKTAEARLEDARQEVLKQLERAIQKRDKQEEQPKDNLDRTRELLEKVRDLRKQQEELAKKPEPDAAKQDALREKTREAQADTAATDPQAAKDVGDAARAMEQASRDLKDQPKDPAAAKPDQQRAAEALKNAEDKLEAREQALAAAEKQAEQVAKAQEQVQEAMRQQSAVNKKTDAAKPEDAKAVAADQQKAQDQTAKAEAEARQADPQAADALKDAQMDQAQAKSDLDKNQPAEAKPDQADAMAKLEQANQKLEQKADELREQLGEPSNDAAQAQAAEKAIREAQEQTKAAESELAKGDPPQQEQAAAQMNQTGEKLDDAAAKAEGALPPETQQEMGEASKALAKGAAQAKAGQKADAAASAQQAQQALARAQQSLADARSKANAQAKGKGKKDGPPPPEANDPTKFSTRSAKTGGDRNDAAGAGGYLGLPAREREALRQSQAEKYPEEYAPLVEQYLRNLSRQPARPAAPEGK